MQTQTTVSYTQCVALLNDAARLTPGRKESATQGPDRLEEARAVLAAATTLLNRDKERVTRILADLSSRFAGVPARPNPWAILGMERDEVRFTKALAWLFNPEGDHGLHDEPLRALLARCSRPEVRVIARRPHTLRAHVFPECRLQHGIADIVLVVEEAVVVVEVKIDASVHWLDHSEAAGLVSQTQAYRLDMEFPSVHERLGRMTGQPAARIARKARGYVFIAPKGVASRDASYVSLSIGNLAWHLAGWAQSPNVSERQRGCLDALVTQMLVAATAHSDGSDLLRRTRICLGETSLAAGGGLALRRRRLVEEWRAMGAGGLS